jgi:hypothetical protein
MSSPIYPTAKGLTWDTVKRTLWNTLVEQTASGAEFRTGTMQYPIYEFDLVYSYLAQTDVDNIIGLYNKSSGGLSPFYFDSRNDDNIPAASPVAFGIGDGSNKVFTLLKSQGGFFEPVGGTTNNWGTNPAVNNVIYDNGTPVSAAAYSASDGGYGPVITFTAAPANTHVLTWTGFYYYLCRFKDDNLDVSQLASLLYEQKGLTLRTAR